MPTDSNAAVRAWDDTRSADDDATAGGADGSDDTSGAETTRRLLNGSWLVVAGLAVGFAGLGAAGVVVPLRYRSLAYLGLMATVSLYHGGFEHVENIRGRGESLQARYLLAYLGLAAAAFALFLAAPVAGLTLSLLVVVLKSGHGDLAVVDRLVGTDHLRTRGQRALAVAVRGGAVLVPAYVVSPGLYAMYGGYMVNVFEAGALDPWLWAFDAPTVAAVGATYAAAVAVHVGLGGVRGGFGRSWRVDAAETLLLVGFFLAVPPAVAIGVYFPCWYAVRGSARLTMDGGAVADRPSSVRGVVARVARGGALPWVAALLLFALATLFLTRVPVSAPGWVGFYSVVVSVVAVPHVAVGSYLDRKQGIWSV